MALAAPNAIGTANAQVAGKDADLSIEADSINFENRGSPRKVNAKGSSRLDDKPQTKPKVYVHFNIDNDNLQTTDGKKPGEAGYNHANASKPDFEKEAYVADEDDLMATRLSAKVGGANPADINQGTFKIERSNGKFRAWGHSNKVHPDPAAPHNGDEFKVLVATDSRTFDMSKANGQDGRGPLLAYTSNAIQIEGYGNDKRQDKTTFTFSYAGTIGGVAIMAKVEIEYVFFASIRPGVAGNRQPTPLERKAMQKAGLPALGVAPAFPKLIGCEWSITAERTGYDVAGAYNCHAYASGTTARNWRDHEIEAEIRVRLGPFPSDNDVLEKREAVYFVDAIRGQAKEVAGTNESNALIVMYGVPVGPANAIIKHSARRVTGGSLADEQLVVYESKMGAEVRIEHVMAQLESTAYGSPLLYLR